MLFLLRILVGMALVGWLVYTALEICAATMWKRSGRSVPLEEYCPPVTILKPVRGVDADAVENFASFCRLDYPPEAFQIVFGILDEDDPVIPILKTLILQYPHIDISLVVGGQAAVRGYNRKVCNLVTMLPLVKHPLLALTDSDMRVTPDYLKKVVIPFKNPDESVGLVTNPYRGMLPDSIVAKFEALSIGADFIPSSLVSRMLEGVSFAFGASIVLPKAVLDEIGGFEILLNELADDYKLAQAVHKAGYVLEISDCMVDDVMGAESFSAAWARRLRWARTIKVSRPGGYAGMLITHGLALAILFALITPWKIGLPVFVGTFVIRTIAAVRISHITHDPNIKRYWFLLPISDILSFILYLWSYAGNTVMWRGEKFSLQSGGKLTIKSEPGKEARPS